MSRVGVLLNAAGVLAVVILSSACSPQAADGGRAAAAADSAASTTQEPRRESGEAGEGEHEANEASFAHIDPSRAPALGIRIAKAAGGSIAETVTLTGQLIIDPLRVASIRARFPGPVVRLYKDVGEAVHADEPLADIESNESLTLYAVRSPLAGVVLERHTNVGDVANEQPLFRVGDPTHLQAQLKAFPSQRSMVSVGAAARVQLGALDVPARVIVIAPEVEATTQAVNVRVAFTAPAGALLLPGQFLTARIEHGRGDAKVVVPYEAVQRLGEHEVIFVPEAEGFRARPVRIGRRGAQFLEILDGLAPDAAYVAQGAVLIKAEIGKNEAADQD